MFDSDVQYGNSSATARKFVSGSEPFVAGHYASDPIFPGVLTLELMLHLGERLVWRETGCASGRIRILRAQYLDILRPGDELEVATTVKRRESRLVHLTSRVSVGDVVKTRATLEYELEA